MEKKVAPTRLEGWGLVVVDMQNDFLAAGGYYGRKRTLDEQIAQRKITPEVRNRLLCQPSTAPAEGFSYRVEALPRIVANTVTVIEFARTQHRPIAYVQAVYSREFDVQPPFLRQDPRREHHPCKPHSWGAAFVEPIHQLTVTRPPTSKERVIAKHTFDGFYQTELLQFLRESGVKTVLVAGVETHVCVLSTALSAAFNHFTALILEDCVWTANAALGQGALAIFRNAFGTTARCDDDLLQALGNSNSA